MPVVAATPSWPVCRKHDNNPLYAIEVICSMIFLMHLLTERLKVRIRGFSDPLGNV
jgi:hypothetical protein